MALSIRGEATVREYWDTDADQRWHPDKLESEIENFPYVKNLSPISSSVSMALVRKRLETLPSLPFAELAYDILHGSKRTRELIASFLSRKLVKDPVSPDQVVVLDGATSILSAIGICLGEEGDRVMVPSEYKHELSFMFACRAKLETVSVSCTEYSKSARDFVRGIQAAWEDSGKESSRIRMIYVAYPNVYGAGLNPGCDTEAMILDNIIAWATSKGLHTIVDITNALNVVDGENVGSSWNGIAAREDVHIIWNVSKFFNIPGACLCTLTTGNKALLEILARKLSIFGSTSRQSQWVIQHLLSDASFIDVFVEENQRNLLTAYNLCVKELQAIGIPYRVASTGYPILLDLAGWTNHSRDDCGTGLNRFIRQCDILASDCTGTRSGLLKDIFLYYAGATPEELKSVLRSLRAHIQGSN
ncbi:unnamed protein product [Agarophyton chilense]